MTEKVTTIVEGPDAAERAEARIEENAAIVEQQTDAQVALIEANARADAERIAAQAEANVDVINAQKGAEEWRAEQVKQRDQISALETQLSTLASQLALILLLPSIAEGLKLSTPPSTEREQTEPLPETPMEVLDEKEEPEEKPQKTAARRRFL